MRQVKFGHKFHPSHPLINGDDVVLAVDFDRILAERDALQSRLNSVEGENDRLLQEAKSLVIQLHAAYGNTEHHEDCQRELLELEKNS